MAPALADQVDPSTVIAPQPFRALARRPGLPGDPGPFDRFGGGGLARLDGDRGGAGNGQDIGQAAILESLSQFGVGATR
ncbi:hypothetical protein GCM10010403_51710 [Glycomyces rutgersensis]|uniref:Uncharacterized protein n=1 Tax=Glycomyces rutgersensis TaxID=58115 RepID=A0ABP5TH47_9ACTN